MFGNKEGSPVDRHLNVMRRLDEVLGSVSADLPDVVRRMTFPWFLFETVVKPLAADDFLPTMRRYEHEGVVFHSPVVGVRYYVRSVDNPGCLIERIDANEPVRCTRALYATRLREIRAAEGRISINDLSTTAAIRAGLLQGASLGLSADRKWVL